MENKEITSIINENDCAGCGACINACPYDALYFGKDKYGYYVPKLDESKCRKCGKCVSVCPVKNHKSSNNKEAEAFCFVNSDKNLLKNSSSGAVFSSLAGVVLKEEGVVFGASWTAENSVKHTYISSQTELWKLQKSKYLQSYIGNTFRIVKEFLEKGRKVLFSGCPCQIAGLQRYLSKDYSTLYLVDLLCGNAPSPGFFSDYIAEEYKDGVLKYEFRHKNGEWRADCEKIVKSDGSIEIRDGEDKDSYQSIYHDHTMCPVHCENCSFHEIPRYGDISIGDFWGVSKHIPELNVNNGVSVVLINNEKGKALFESISQNEIGFIKKVPLEWIGGNGYLGKGSKNFISPFRDEFYEKYLEVGFERAFTSIRTKQLSFQFDKVKKDYQVLLKWLELIQKGTTFGDKLLSQGLQRIAIYGFGEVGKLIYEDLKGSSIKVAYIIDRNPNSGSIDIPVLGLNDLYPVVDAIIVSLPWDYGNIRKALEERTTCKIMSILEILN